MSEEFQNAIAMQLGCPTEDEWDKALTVSGIPAGTTGRVLSLLLSVSLF